MDHHYKIYLDSIYECGPSLLFKKTNCDQRIYQDRNGPAHVKYENEEESPCTTTNCRKRKANNAKKVCIDWNGLLNDSEFNENYRNFLKCLRYPSNEEGITTFCFNNDVSFKCERGRRKEPIIDEQEEDSGADISDDDEGNDDDGTGNKENKDYIYNGDNVEAIDVDDDSDVGSEDNTDIDYEHDEERQEDTDIDDSDNVEVTDVDDNDSSGADNEDGIDVEDETDIDDEDDAHENNATEEEVEEEDDDVGDGEDECEGEDGDENEDTDVEDDKDKYVDTDDDEDDDEDDDDVDDDVDDDDDDDEGEGVYSCTEKSSQISISPTEYNSFDIRLKKETKRPFNQHEYDRLMRKATERKAIIKDRKLRSGDKTYQTNVVGKSYFDHFPDVKAKVLAANKPKALKLLRGFFFWLQNLCHEGSYQPWVGRYRV